MGNLGIVFLVLCLAAVVLAMVGAAMVCLDREVDPRAR
jgi:hypothetical protein